MKKIARGLTHTDRKIHLYSFSFIVMIDKKVS